MTTQTPDAVRETIVAAITKADANFGYSYRLTKMDDTGEEHTLFMDGFEPVVFQDREDGYPVIEQRRNAARTDAILAAFYERMFALDRVQIALIVSRFKAVPGDRCNLATRAAWNAALETADMILAAALDSRAGDAGEGMARHLLDALNDSEELMNGDIVLTADHAKQLNADVDAWEAAEPFSPEDAWDELVNADDRTSPEEYPDMCLITRDELIDFMARATPAPAVDALQAQEEAEDARSTCECEGEGQWEHCGPCSLRFGRAIELRRAALSLTPAVDGEERRPDSTPVPGDARSIDGELCFYRSPGWYPSPVVDVIQVDENGEAMACAGCGTTQALPAIKARAPQALSCCPERKMVPVRSLWAAPAVDAVPAGEVSDMAWFGGQHRLSLSHCSPMYGDDDDQSIEWRVMRESGPINDREWDIVGRGPTPYEAVAAARASLSHGEGRK